MSTRTNIEEMEFRLAQQIYHAAAGDDEAAHSNEDAAFVSALRAIAEGAADPQAVAMRALTACDVKHARWCA